MRVNKHIVDTKQFINIENPKTSYLLGLLWADGSITERPKKNEKSIQISILSSDFKQIESIFKESGDWNISYGKQHLKYKNWKPQTRAYIYNKTLYDYLKTNNYKEKNLAPRIIENIPSEFKHYWFRGLLDGDGCIDIKYKRFHLSSEHDQDWTFMVKLCEELDISGKIYKEIRKNGKSSYFSISGINNLKKFLDYIYKGENFGFNRKYEKYKTFENFYLKNYKRLNKTKCIFNQKNNWFYQFYEKSKRYYKGGFKSEQEAFEAYLKIKTPLAIG